MTDLSARPVPNVRITDDHLCPGRQPRRDRPPGLRHLPPTWASPRSRSTPTPTPPTRTSSEADAAVHLPGSSAAETYLRGDLVIDAAAARRRRRRAPRLRLPLRERRLRAAPSWPPGLTWIGPPPRAIDSMGSKIEAKALMAAAGVPVLGELDPATITDADLPVLVKASAGGGGRGMRIVTDVDALPGEIELASAEAASAFGDPTVFCEPYLADRSPHRGPGDGRSARHGLGRRRARMLHPAPPPEDHRGGTVARRSTRRCAPR